MPEKQKLKRLSSRFSGPYRMILYAAYSALVIALIYYLMGSVSFFSIYQSALCIVAAYILIKMTYRMQRVAFDDEYLYVYLRGQDLIIPLENIESVEIESLGGLYKVNLYHPEQVGKEIYFKTSLLYPLNYQSKDALVNELRSAIVKARQKYREFPRNALMS